MGCVPNTRPATCPGVYSRSPGKAGLTYFMPQRPSHGTVMWVSDEADRGTLPYIPQSCTVCTCCCDVLYLYTTLLPSASANLTLAADKATPAQDCAHTDCRLPVTFRR